jgi:hypothetical protein
MTPDIPVSAIEIKLKPSALRVLTIDPASSFASGRVG